MWSKSFYIFTEFIFKYPSCKDQHDVHTYPQILKDAAESLQLMVEAFLFLF